MLRNKLVKVDIFDNQLGVIEKIDAHKSPVLHRAFSVFLYNDKNEILIQKRAQNKYHSGGLWANACCSHPSIDEDIVVSAQNKLNEELGIFCPLEEKFTFTYLHKFNDNLFEYELYHVLIGNYNSKITLNKEEASEYMWVTCDKICYMLTYSPEIFASWFIICAPKIIEIIKNFNWQFLLYVITFLYP